MNLSEVSLTSLCEIVFFVWLLFIYFFCLDMCGLLPLHFREIFIFKPRESILTSFIHCLGVIIKLCKRVKVEIRLK